MGVRGWAIACVVLGLVGWWFSPLSPRLPEAPKITGTGGTIASAAACPPPPQVARGMVPLQSAVPHDFPVAAVEDARLTALAGFSVDARVLSRRDYTLGREATYSPTDLVLGWGRMRDDAVLDRLDIGQHGRWYSYRWSSDGAPIPPGEIARSSANMHIVPADAAAAAALRRLRAGQRVRIDGWLVRLDAPDGWTWRSSLTRDDTGAGACELIYACSIRGE